MPFKVHNKRKCLPLDKTLKTFFSKNRSKVRFGYLLHSHYSLTAVGFGNSKREREYMRDVMKCSAQWCYRVRPEVNEALEVANEYLRNEYGYQ